MSGLDGKGFALIPALARSQLLTKHPNPSDPLHRTQYWVTYSFLVRGQPLAYIVGTIGASPKPHFMACLTPPLAAMSTGC